ncbi:MAG: septum formation protein Maf [Candidatus Woykebacteria bacterium RBG_13_40_7b]|uniref:Nucleoside triphosphate pyrophosphatase n=1 Tax=Candidatus Woykebacteria bacterium RBG_13_40_7b TaxID=1802594 RepID=A0A1G1WBJ1_9BACT|nr:MAG: septum formation protein Maf [Candidatus Woykebacteria bacterium RBG_13_40_7b]
MKPLILASVSPRREYLLKAFGVPFKVIPSDFYERSVLETNPEKLALKLALAKARRVAEKEEGVIVGADTLTVFEGKILNKPRTMEEAKKFFRGFRDHPHRLISAVAFIDTVSGTEKTITAEIEVWFKNLPDKVLDDYLDHHYPLDKSAGYNISQASDFIDRAVGEYSIHLGLPMNEVAKVLEEFGFKINRLDYEEYARGYRE